MADLRLSLADQVLVNVAAAIALPVIRPDAREAMLMEIVAEAIGRGNPDNPKMLPIVTSLSTLMTMPPADRRREFERMALRDALAEFFTWRASLALAALRNEGAAQ